MSSKKQDTQSPCFLCPNDAHCKRHWSEVVDCKKYMSYVFGSKRKKTKPDISEEKEPDPYLQRIIRWATWKEN